MVRRPPESPTIATPSLDALIELIQDDGSSHGSARRVQLIIQLRHARSDALDLQGIAAQ
jgi:hypothetical protein